MFFIVLCGEVDQQLSVWSDFVLGNYFSYPNFNYKFEDQLKILPGDSNLVSMLGKLFMELTVMIEDFIKLIHFNNQEFSNSVLIVFILHN
jgi:hypothetical protein